MESVEVPVLVAATAEDGARLEAVAAIVAAMCDHPGDAAAAERNCVLLHGATVDRSGQQAAVNAGAPAAIVAAMVITRTSPALPCGAAGLWEASSWTTLQASLPP